VLILSISIARAKIDMLNLRHIEFFHAIMRTGSVTTAAQAPSVSQPAVSAVLNISRVATNDDLRDRRDSATPVALLSARVQTEGANGFPAALIALPAPQAR
jgi:hypothetical protein